jgi:hypothetical protein
MPDDLTDMFAESMAEPVVDEVTVDNQDDVLADEMEETEAFEVDDDFDDEDADTDDESPVAENVEDDFDFAEIVEKYGDRTVKVMVQGEEVEVPIRDLPSGFMRREDYSRKTAETAQYVKAAQWAQDVQAALDADPFSTLNAFAAAYGIQGNFAGPTEVDPYENLDPDIAAVMRKMDEQEQRHQHELMAVRQQTESFATDRIKQEVKAEVQALESLYGDELDTVEMLRIAATYNMPLNEAAETLVGRRYYQQTQAQRQAGSQAQQAAKSKAGSVRSSAKRRASSTGRSSFDTEATVNPDDFNTISELFEIEMNSIS